MVKNPPAMRETWVRSLGWEDPLEEGIATHFSILAWRIQRSLAGCSPWGHQELDTTEWLSAAHRGKKSFGRLFRLMWYHHWNKFHQRLSCSKKPIKKDLNNPSIFSGRPVLDYSFSYKAWDGRILQTNFSLTSKNWKCAGNIWILFGHCI